MAAKDCFIKDADPRICNNRIVSADGKTLNYYHTFCDKTKECQSCDKNEREINIANIQKCIELRRQFMRECVKPTPECQDIGHVKAIEYQETRLNKCFDKCSTRLDIQRARADILSKINTLTNKKRKEHNPEGDMVLINEIEDMIEDFEIDVNTIDSKSSEEKEKLGVPNDFIKKQKKFISEGFKTLQEVKSLQFDFDQALLISEEIRKKDIEKERLRIKEEEETNKEKERQRKIKKDEHRQKEKQKVQERKKEKNKREEEKRKRIEKEQELERKRIEEEASQESLFTTVGKWFGFI